MADKSKRLGSERVGKLLFDFSLPAIIGTATFGSTSIINTIFVGRGVGSLALTAISLSGPIFMIFMSVGMLVGIGSGALTSIRLGEGKTDEAERILGNAFFLFLSLAAVTALLGLTFIDPMLRAFGASRESLPLARDYIRILMAGVVLNYLTMGMNNLIRAEGNPNIAMLTLIIGALINVTLNYVFVFRLGVGIQGAALATIISQSVSSAWALAHFRPGHGTLVLRARNILPDRRIILSILPLGLPMFLMQLSGSLMGMVANNALGRNGGDVAIGAMGVIVSISMFLLMPIIGINQGSQPVFGYNFGARRFDRVKRALRLAIMAATIIATTGFLVVHLVPEPLIRLFNRDPGLVAVTEHGIRIFMAMFFLVGFQAVSANFFLSIGKPYLSIFLNLLRQVILFIPLVLILPSFFKLDGVWISGPISDALAVGITLIVLVVQYRRLK